MLEIFESRNLKKNKWLLIILVAIIFLILLNLKKDSYYIFEHAGNVANVIGSNNNETVRKLEDYYTPKSLPETRVINLKCKIDGKDYYLAKVKKDKFNSNCPICNLTKVKDSMLVLVNSNAVIKENCYAEELVKCYNTQNISDCPTHALNQCDPKKISSNNTEFILDNITSGIIKDGVVTHPSFALKINDPENTGILLSLWEMKNTKSTPSATPSTTQSAISQKNYIVCLDDVIGALDNKQKLYLNTENLPKDKIRFKIFFKLDEHVKYLGVCNSKLCDNMVCNKPECDDDIKFLCLYDDITNTNVINFEPELVKHLKTKKM
jgi:hypothetical protein